MGLVKSLSIGLVSTSLMVTVLATNAKAEKAGSLSLQYDTSIGRPANLQQGEFPGVPGTLAVPQGIAVDESGNIYISNGRGIDRVDVFDSQGNYIRGIGSSGKGPGQIDEPLDVKFSPVDGNLYVGDGFNNRIDVFDRNGNFVKSFGSFQGPIEGRFFFGPGGMQFDKKGNLYVTDFTADVVKVYDIDGNLIKTFGSTGTGPGEFQGPAGLNISKRTGNIFINDQYNNRVQVFNPQGKFLYTFGSEGQQPGQFQQPIGIELDEHDNIYVTDSINSRVQVFDKKGNFLTAYGQPARNASGELVLPPAIGGPTPYGDPIDLTPGVFNWTGGEHYANGKLYVGDFYQGRVQVLNVVKNKNLRQSSSSRRY
ncbi:scytonemin biosynthesis PEP-CTERM protein ScyF [Aetokthonos hydrillicola Thurmond2011]|jgi:DNA-binding beta-propeller fold protein YncE|uniref:Scytonemin biosynthesis PEP-CTERM protein ScyF n=1 Tax=Aetokthonos hydrillicola Thurmond2011 TaxID=2712845 RepID=A0AAP5MA01_9CYAN|nr:scytonemin biosynthesis PEP-CTERM protein ScyF [Aetokthonos hydrillicola]MBO3458958.1 scytonemin biosynthesis PEP-CTERM protein ScyF [Aetokthonos hydrillicola CCALA 1050]MBW4589065.1 scytonemin biosynthesis PEP-CTERM protein ScyF [Aetokthonos hydrillicola CCALA 1050]MDR9894979.1 scytonemin biosynthesis PEP-CTERM protein ScyF [Aetokthonos hydrillicola Thurmond2011]